MTVLELLDYAGVAVFAATGALSASRKQIDIIGFLFLALVTGVGGGTLRDIIIGTLPVFWVNNPVYIVVCITVGLIVFFTAHLVESRYRLLLWFDAIGLSAYCVMGAAKGLSVTGSPIIAIVTGVMTASFGGILRDVLADEPSVLLRPEIYITAALIGAAAFTVATLAGTSLIFASVVGTLSAFVVRAGALRFGWCFPVYKPRPGRRPEDVM
ncbi:trimeric intracellular cation channel family protein [Sinorhizobium sp. BG8]|uniref:trimeric intracellular cation channel family protein n=1 Tax=Sinorhizobium sp. BG8 TaxID=2613773 RepID=UPI00193D78F1|nr:trimeric intracellular cation channel family protein [Sinorhizobium sp. BG8]QRM53855.1 trimeric intracellular cation channel family protein [Sinorhizobium sp. BG8]